MVRKVILRGQFLSPHDPIFLAPAPPDLFPGVQLSILDLIPPVHTGIQQPLLDLFRTHVESGPPAEVVDTAPGPGILAQISLAQRRVGYLPVAVLERPHVGEILRQHSGGRRRHLPQRTQLLHRNRLPLELGEHIQIDPHLQHRTENRAGRHAQQRIGREIAVVLEHEILSEKCLRSVPRSHLHLVPSGFRTHHPYLSSNHATAKSFKSPASNRYDSATPTLPFLPFPCAMYSSARRGK